MSDLISRSEVLELLYKIFDKYHMSTDKNTSIGKSFGTDVFKEIKKMPTAYDVDKVVKELEKIRAKETCNKEKCDTKEICRICVVDDATEIVKQGDVSDDVDVCEWRIVDRPHNLPIYNTSCGKIRMQYTTGVDIYCNGCGKKIKVIQNDN